MIKFCYVKHFYRYSCTVSGEYFGFQKKYITYIFKIHFCIIYLMIIIICRRLVVFMYIYIYIAIALDERIFLDVLHFPMKNIKSRDLEATPMGGATSNPASGFVCLLLLL